MIGYDEKVCDPGRKNLEMYLACKVGMIAVQLFLAYSSYIYPF
jgi:hypothetical protein